jgi:hypothetical protein
MTKWGAAVPMARMPHGPFSPLDPVGQNEDEKPMGSYGLFCCSARDSKAAVGNHWPGANATTLLATQVLTPRSRERITYFYPVT